MDAQLTQDNRIREFDRKHGEHYREQGFVYFADGSVRESPYGFLLACEYLDTKVPAEEYRLANNKLKFARLKLQNAVDSFDELNTRLAHAQVTITEQEIAKLEQLQNVVYERRAALSKAEQALNNTRVGRGQNSNPAGRRGTAAALQRSPTTTQSNQNLIYDNIKGSMAATSRRNLRRD